MKCFRLVKLLAIPALLFAVLIVGSVISQQVVLADDPVVPTTAIVDPATVPPNIECKWELPDMFTGDLVAQNPYPDASFEYGAGTGAAHDDDPVKGPTPNPACTLVDPDGTAGPLPPAAFMPEGVKNKIQVRPNPDDLPEQRRIQLWMAVDHPLGISAITDVYWDVYHPDGTRKVQVHGVKVPLADIAPTNKLGYSSTDGSMFHAASNVDGTGNTGQISAQAIDDINYGIVAKAQQEEKAIYYAEFPLSKEQPCGEYKIVATAVGLGGSTDTLTNYIDVICTFYLQIDFTKVDWGAIQPGLTDWVSGDLIWGNNVPTVRNVGNHGMGLKLHYSLMTGIASTKTIDQFDAKFGRTPSTLQSIDPMFASTWYEFDNDRERTLCSNEQGKIDFSIHPPSSLPQDTYKGTLDLVGKANHNTLTAALCPTDQEVHP